MLTEEELEELEIPPLPSYDDAGWHKATEEWWEDIWSSPMAPEWDPSDIHGLYILAVLVDNFWNDPCAKTATEIRHQRQSFGLTPIDRRRLQWEIDRGDEAEKRTQDRNKPRAVAVSDQPDSGDDPRLALA